MDRVKRIDIHAHVTAFPEYAPTCKWQGRFCSAEELIEKYDALNIEKGVILPISSAEGQITPMTSEAAKYVADKYHDRFYWFCNIDPRALTNGTSNDLSPLFEHYISLGAKGVGEITCQLYLDDPYVDRLFTFAERYSLPVLLHLATRFGGMYGLVEEKAGLYRLERMLDRHPDLNIIGHSQAFWSEISSDCPESQRGGAPSGRVIEGRLAHLLRTYPNLWCDLSAGSGANAIMRDEEYGMHFLEEFSDRVLYGCDICAVANEHQNRMDEYLKRKYREGALKHEVWEKLARKNAIKLLSLEDK